MKEEDVDSLNEELESSNPDESDHEK